MRVIDLFCGAGGMTLGFARLSRGAFKPIWAVDNNRHAVETYNSNFGRHCESIDIVERLKDGDIPEAEVVIGGPPCQGFSLLNKNRAGDARKQLWRPFMEVVERSGAEVFVMENVPSLMGTPEHDEILQCAEELGFYTRSAKLCAADYGAAQTRHRVFILGSRFALADEDFPPPATHFRRERDPDGDKGPHPREDDDEDDDDDELEYDRRRRKRKPSRGSAARGAAGVALRPWVTVRQAVGELKPPVGTEIRDTSPPYDLHFGRNPTALSRARYRAIPREGMNRFDLQKRAPELTPACWIRKKTGGTDLFGRLWWDRPAFTIRTEFYKPEKGRYLHPEQHRPITHREAARFQSFPDDFVFKGSKGEIARQIGNAVPPLLAARVADAVYDLFRR